MKLNYIIKKTKDYLIVNKPSGLLVHGAKHLDEESLADILVKKYPKIKKVGEDPWRPGIVHRLDKLVSGLLVIARTQEFYNHVKEQFQNRTIEKYYTALVYGKIERDEGEVNFPIVRSPKGNKMSALPATTKGKATTAGRRAITEFTIIKRFINYTLLDVKIKTGRTHQIRVHMAAIGHPVVGDDLYGTKKTRVKNKKLGLERIFLHAYKLAFTDLKGERQEFRSELPEGLEEFLQITK